MNDKNKKIAIILLQMVTVVVLVLLVNHKLNSPKATPNLTIPESEVILGEDPSVKDPEYQGMIVSIFTNERVYQQKIGEDESIRINTVGNESQAIDMDNLIDLSIVAKIELEQRSKDSNGELRSYVATGKVEINDEEFANIWNGNSSNVNEIIVHNRGEFYHFTIQY